MAKYSQYLKQYIKVYKDIYKVPRAPKYILDNEYYK